MFIEHLLHGRYCYSKSWGTAVPKWSPTPAFWALTFWWFQIFHDFWPQLCPCSDQGLMRQFSALPLLFCNENLCCLFPWLWVFLLPWGYQVYGVGVGSEHLYSWGSLSLMPLRLGWVGFWQVRWYGRLGASSSR